MSRRKANSKPPQTWRQVPQIGNTRRTRTSKARWRSFRLSLRHSLALCSVLILLGGGYLAYQWVSQPAALSLKKSLLSPQIPLRTVKFSSDGVLSRDWLAGHVETLQGEKLMELELGELKLKLERSGQVAEAQITRQMPNILRIHIVERQPLLRARVRETDGSMADLLIARDGTVYRGTGYDTSTLRSLPFLAGVGLKRSANGYQPLAWAPQLAAFMEQASARLPDPYAEWKSIAVEEFSDEARTAFRRVRIQSRHSGELIFSTEALDIQIRQLLRVARALEGREGIAHIDLTQHNKVIVGYESARRQRWETGL